MTEKMWDAWLGEGLWDEEGWVYYFQGRNCFFLVISEFQSKLNIWFQVDGSPLDHMQKYWRTQVMSVPYSRGCVRMRVDSLVSIMSQEEKKFCDAWYNGTKRSLYMPQSLFSPWQGIISKIILWRDLMSTWKFWKFERLACTLISTKHSHTSSQKIMIPCK